MVKTIARVGKLICAFLVLQPAAPLFAQSDLPAIVDRVEDAVVYISAGDDLGALSQGSGFLFPDSRHVLTCYHVVAGAADVTVEFKDGTKIQAAGVVSLSEEHDIALIQLEESVGTSPLVLAKALPRVGQDVFSIGAPQGIKWTVTKGIVSGVHLDHVRIPNRIQTDCSLHSGSSGGPIFTLEGEVVGIAQAKPVDRQGGGLLDGVSYLTPCTLIREHRPSSRVRRFDGLSPRFGDYSPSDISVSKPFFKGLQSLLNEEYDEAAQVMRERLQRGNNDFTWLWKSTPTLQEMERAKPFFRESQNDVDYGVWSSIWLAEIERQQGGVSECLAHVKRALASAGNAVQRAWLLRIKAGALRQQGDLVEASNVMLMAVKARPDDTVLVKQAVFHWHNLAQAAWAEAWAAIGQGDQRWARTKRAQAKNACEYVLEYDPTHLKGHELRGLIYWAYNDMRNAWKEYRWVLQRDQARAAEMAKVLNMRV
ncbi:serine protease [bacterium]|nr:serine protease [bacterium]